LAVNATLTSLDVGYNDLNEETALSIVRIERQRNKLTTLGLACCEIGPTGAKEIAEWVSVSALTDLNLMWNQIGDEGAIAIGEALRVNASLTSLDLANNWIGDKGGVAIANALAVNATLTKLGLGYNSIGDEAKGTIRNAARASLKIDM